MQRKSVKEYRAQEISLTQLEEANCPIKEVTG
jgi:hypothetical protein